MNEVRTRDVDARQNPDGTWHVVFRKLDGEVLVCPNAPEALMLQAVEAGNRQQPPAPETSGLAAVLAFVLSPTGLTALATSLLLYGRC